MPAPTKPPAKGGSILTRKLGPLPGWAWAALGVGAFYLWKKHEAASTAASTATDATAQPSLPTSDTTAPSGYGYQGPGVGTGGSGPIPTGAMAHTGRHHGSGVAATSPNVNVASPTTANQPVPASVSNPSPYLLAPGPPAASVTASNNANAAQAYTNAVGSNAASLYEAYAATLPPGGLAAGQPMNAQQQAALNAYNQAVAANG